jgi:hypothetical protein
MKDRLMIDVFKKEIREKELDPNLLRGSWTEASDLLVAHYGNLSGVMLANQYKLLALYQLSIMEMQTSSVCPLPQKRWRSQLGAVLFAKNCGSGNLTFE